MKKKIKCIIFDYGCVISKKQDTGYIKKMSDILNIEENKFIVEYYNYRYDYDKGLITAYQYWEKISQPSNIKITSEIITELIQYDIKSWTDINNAMLAYILDIKNKVNKIAVLSNMNIETLNYVKENFSWIKKFDETIFSCEVGHNKPEKEIYERCIEKIGLNPVDCVLIDDSIENIQGANNYYINTIHYKDFENFKKEMKKNFRLCSN